MIWFWMSQEGQRQSVYLFENRMLFMILLSWNRPLWWGFFVARNRCVTLKSWKYLLLALLSLNLGGLQWKVKFRIKINMKCANDIRSAAFVTLNLEAAWQQLLTAAQHKLHKERKWKSGQRNIQTIFLQNYTNTNNYIQTHNPHGSTFYVKYELTSAALSIIWIEYIS